MGLSLCMERSVSQQKQTGGAALARRMHYVIQASKKGYRKEVKAECCTVCFCAVYVCDSHHMRALDPNAPAWSESTTCEGKKLRDALLKVQELERRGVSKK